MFPLYFTANLYSPEGKLLEMGEACLSNMENAVEFNSDFVPLLPLDSTATITRTIGERRMESYRGKVFRSTKNLLQLTEIPAAQMETALRLFAVNANLPITFAAGPVGSVRFNIKNADTFTGSLRFVSPDVVKIAVMEFVGEGQTIAFSVDTPSLRLKELRVCVVERMLLKRGSAVLLCEPVLVGWGNKRALANYKPPLEDASSAKLPETPAENTSAADDNPTEKAVQKMESTP